MEKAQRITTASYLEILVHEAITQHHYPSDQQDLDATVIEIENEKTLLITSLNDEENLEVYVKARQRQLVRLIDLMSGYCAKQDVYMNIYNSLGELLNYLERHYACYLDENCKIPFPYLLITQELMMKDINEIENALSANDVDPELYEMLLHPFHKLIAVEDNDFLYSYQEIVYLTKLYQELREEIQTDEELIELLLYYNFNDPDVFVYLTGKIRKQMDEMPSVNTKKDILLMLQRNTHRIPANPGMYFRKLQQPLKKQFLRWLSRELSWLDSFEDRHFEPGEMDVWKDHKVMTGLTVEQLGRFFGLLQEKGIIQTENKQELALFISTFFSTAQRDYIAPDSIRRSFYNKDADLAKSLRDIFIELINISRQP
jgi:hypothetical protein